MDDDRLNRHGLTDAEWALLEPLLPRHPRQGRRWNDHRVVIDGVFHRVRGQGTFTRRLGGAGLDSGRGFDLEHALSPRLVGHGWFNAAGDHRRRAGRG